MNESEFDKFPDIEPVLNEMNSSFQKELSHFQAEDTKIGLGSLSGMFALFALFILANTSNLERASRSLHSL